MSDSDRLPDKKCVPDERARRILDEATRLILHYGYDKTTMSDIAAASGVSKSTLYLYWQSKDALFRAMLTRETLDLTDDWLQRVQTDPQGGKLYGIYRHGFLALLAHPFSSALYTKESHVLGEYVRRRDPAAHIRPYYLNLAFVQKLQSAGLVRTDMRAEVINHLLTLISIGLFSIGELLPRDQAPPFEEVANALAEMVHSSLAAQAGDSERGKRALREYLAQLTSDFK